jgi:hypothetical protein
MGNNNSQEKSTQNDTDSIPIILILYYRYDTNCILEEFPSDIIGVILDFFIQLRRVVEFELFENTLENSGERYRFGRKLPYYIEIGPANRGICLFNPIHTKKHPYF